MGSSVFAKYPPPHADAGQLLKMADALGIEDKGDATTLADLVTIATGLAVPESQVVPAKPEEIGDIGY